MTRTARWLFLSCVTFYELLKLRVMQAQVFMTSLEHNIQDAAIECYDFHVDVLLNCDGYKKHTKITEYQ